MIAWLSARVGKAGALALAFVAMFAVVSIGAWAALREFDRIIDRAATSAKAERDAFWRSEIDKANLATAQNIIEQMKQSARIEEQTRTTIDDLRNQLTEMEKANAALPENTGRGIGRDRVRLLNNQAGSNREK